MDAQDADGNTPLHSTILSNEAFEAMDYLLSMYVKTFFIEIYNEKKNCLHIV